MKDMKDVKPIIAKNLAALRRAHRLTQAELAERLSYSDKAVSRWEQGETLPDMNVLCELCSFYGITLDELVREEDGQRVLARTGGIRRALLFSFFWATIALVMVSVAFVVLVCTHDSGYFHSYSWILYVWAVPLCCGVFLISSRRWSGKVLLLCMRSVTVWTLLGAVYVQLLFLGYNFWQIFFIGAPLQATLILWQRLHRS